MTVQPPQDQQAPASGGTRQRALIVLLLIVAVVALLFTLLMGGEEEPSETGTPRPRPTTARSPSPEPTEDDLPPESSTDFSGRDPFQPLVTAVEPVGPGTDPGVVPTETPTGTVGGTDGDGDGAPDEVRRVGLLDVFSEDGERMATVDVDGDQYTVAEGETFAGSFRLLDLTRDCGTFVYGDERFTLCIGQEVNK